MPSEKQYIIKIFNDDRSALLKTLTSERPEDGSLFYLKNVPNFRSKINGGFGECVLDIATDFDSFEEGTTINFMNVVEIHAVVLDTESKTQTSYEIYNGFISKYEPYVRGSEEGVSVTCLGFVSIPSFIFYKTGASFTVVHSAGDPQDIGRAVVDYVNSIYTNNLLSYSNDTTDPTGTSVSITFVDQKCAEALKKNGELTPQGWWWKIDEIGQYWLKPKPATPTHTFTIGKDIVSINAPKDSEKVVNDVVVRGDTVTGTDTNAASQTAFGVRSKIVSDTQLKNQSAVDQRAGKEVDDGGGEKIQATLVINDNYAIETIKVGETCKVRNFANSNTFFGSNNMLIVGVQYQGTTCRVEVEALGSDFATELSQLVA